jgi:hypothetical protein
MRITPQLRRQQELWKTCRLAAAAVVDSLKCPDLLEHVPADNGAGTFLSPAPNDRRPDLLEHAPADNGAGTFLSPAPNHKRPDLSEHAPADNGAGTFLSPAPNHKRPDLSEHAPADNGAGTFLSTNPESKRGLESPRSVPPASSANGALYTSLGQRPRSVGASHAGPMGRAFSPPEMTRTGTWAVGPGWYDSGPLALMSQKARPFRA